MSASEDAETERVVVLEWMGPDHTRKRVSVAPLEGTGRWLVRWEWRRDDGGWETMQATEATDVPNVGGRGGAPNVDGEGGSAS